MNRRDFLGASAVASLALFPASGATNGNGATGRRVVPFNHKWRYLAKAPRGVLDREFDDAEFTEVILPHANIVLPWHSFDDSAYEFVSAYRRRFRLPDELKNHRVFVDFEGAMTASTVAINGHRFDEYKGGYTPFSFELTPHLDWTGENVLAVQLDSTERRDIPPFGGEIDYLTFGGIYREVSLRFVPQTFIENVFARPVDVLDGSRRVDVQVWLSGGRAQGAVTAELRDGDRVIASGRGEASAANVPVAISLNNLGGVQLWELERPRLYTVTARLENGDEYSTRIGFREARFTEKGFYLNGKHLKLRGLNRHQTFPYVGGAMPARVQRRDARILKDTHINLVRTSHYPQSRHFLDACDESGLLVLEEIPGWQHIGDNEWQDVTVRNVGEMIRRDWNHPSIILWGVRINESKDDHTFYTRTNALAHQLDPSRPTGGIRYLYNSELLEDVFTMNDFEFPLKAPNHPKYLNTEFVGHTYSTKRIDQVERVAEHTMRHARVHNQLGSNDQYAGGIGWCAFDYNTHSNFGSGDRICYHGVFDIFRIPKAAAGFYKAQVNPAVEVVLEPGFDWSNGDHSGAGGPGIVPVWSNCDRLVISIAGKQWADEKPDRNLFPNLPHPPFMVKFEGVWGIWGDLVIDGYLGDRKVITRKYSGDGVDKQLIVEPDDTELVGDGSDATRVLLRVADQYGNTQQFATAAVGLSVEGPAEIVGENPFALVGGAGAVWLKTKQGAGTVRLTVTHPYLPGRVVELRITEGPAIEI